MSRSPRRDRTAAHAVRIAGLSARLDLRAVGVTVVALVLAVAVGAFSLTVGDFEIPFGQVLRTLAGQESLILTDVVVDNRLPRVLVGLGVGAAFAISGAIFQRLARNPLVSPDLIGINAGAALAAVVLITVAGAGSGWLPAGALTGSLLTAVAVYLLAYRRGIAGSRLVLVGIGVTAIIGSLTAYLLTLADIYTAKNALMWLSGSLAGRSWPEATMIGLTLLVLVPAALAASRQLRLLELGDDLARTLAGRVELSRGLLIAVGVGLAALATAAAGPIAFVALVAPQIARRLLAERGAGLLAAGALGALLVVAADLVARQLFAPTPLPVGVVTAFLGAPYLLLLMARANRVGRGG
ncbi:transport system permease protein [Kribbella flavida DSM 17836]|uniref:Transport system permease protein n=1 Tax=Kribbella flavida (strain DSM 17836 / JCM 10339 / NBRC 14399) TaxID=479435 RepID=D2PX73_KRIFD|nr:iron chelate uptake ABC transporter family permease subunit [Kribbella flavida]ADB29721.1 transport system permease protein [Kribbella flavida DSM 17836]